MTAQAPAVKKQRHCKICVRDTEQELRAERTGAAWHCMVCTSVGDRYTHAQMRDFLSGQHTPPAVKPHGLDPAKVKIFLAHPDGEIELATPFVKQHLEITGELPRKGQPVYTRGPDFAPTQGLGLEIPYGSVTRVEVLP